MRHMRTIEMPTAIIALLITIAAPARSQDLAGARKALNSKYALTVTTADKTDIVTPGCVLVLKKSNLIAASVSNAYLFQNSFKNGAITQNALGKTQNWLRKMPGTAADASDRVFVSGEKLWVTGIDVKENGVVLTLFSDPYNDVRYTAALKFPFPKGSTPSVNDIVTTVGEVFDIQPSDDGKGQQQASTGGPPPPIAPPPPPPAEPKTISLGQTPDQVTANFGPPDRIVKLSAKQIYFYKDMKVTFVSGKVADVQ
jgi:hypothetical protein